nr:hypothetical protein [uncultured Sphaerochaeta sp.]
MLLQAGCALIGGETAEMPGFYQRGEYDLAGFCVAVAEKERIFDPSTIKSGDCLLALPSSGVHSNGSPSSGRSLIWMPILPCFFIGMRELGCTLGEELLTPTRIYVSEVLELARKDFIKGGKPHYPEGDSMRIFPGCFPWPWSCHPWGIDQAETNLWSHPTNRINS